MEILRLKIWAARKGEFAQKLSRLNKILAKMGKPPMTCSIQNERYETYTFTIHTNGERHDLDREEKRPVQVCEVVINGEPVVRKDDRDYTFLGTVTMLEGVKRVDCKDETYLPYFTDKFREDVCDHCGVRRQRNKYYLIKGEKVMQIGSSCVDEFFGIDVLKYLDAIGSLYEVVREPSYEEYSANRKACDYVWFDELCHIVDDVTHDFQIYQKATEDISTPSTADMVREVVRSGGIACTEPLKITRQEVLDYWTAKTPSAFQVNVLEALKSESVMIQMCLGTAVYAIYEAGREKFHHVDRTEAKHLDEHYGEVGEKFQMELRLERITPCETMFGTSYLCIMRDADGRMYKWFASKEPAIELGCKAMVNGVVKSHDIFDQKKQTVLTRCRVVA